MNSNIIERSKQTFLEKLDEHLKILEIKTNMKRENFSTLVIVSFIFIWIGLFDIYVSYVITILYPSIWTLSEIRKKEMDGAKQWLTYWVIFSLFVVIDMIWPYFKSFIPFYVFIRTIILMWLHLPNFRGAVVVYNSFILEILKYTNNFAFISTGDKNKLLTEIEEILQRKSKDTSSPACGSVRNSVHNSNNTSLNNNNNMSEKDKDKKNN